MIITSRSNERIKAARALQDAKARRETGLHLIEGDKLVLDALASGAHVRTVFAKEGAKAPDGIETVYVSEGVMDAICTAKTPQSLCAIAETPDCACPEVYPEGLIVALDRLQDPGNLGTILRIADWFGIRQVLASPDTVECYNPKVVQATMGAIFRVRVHYCDLPKALPAGLPVYGTFLEGDNIYQAPLTRGGILVMGSEADGISPEVAAAVDRKLFIPPFPADAHTSESLNVAVATAITCAEFRRRSG
jgi:rRNA methylases